MTLEQLLSDALVTDAIILNLLIIGEAVNKLPSELTKTQKHIPWQEIIGLRNVIAHEYFRLDTEIIWDTVQNELSPLLASVEALIYQLEA